MATLQHANIIDLFDWNKYVSARLNQVSYARATKKLEKMYVEIERIVLSRAKFYAGEMLKDFIMNQRIYATDERGKFWTNRTHLAAMSWFTGAAVEGTDVVMYAAHGNEVYYAKYLEYYMDRRFESLRPMLNKYGPKFIESVRKILVRRGG